GRQERINGMPAWKLAFKERAFPSVVRINRVDVLSSGAIWTTEEGTILRTEFVIDTWTGHLSVTVDFSRDAKLGVWVPKQMEERYPGLRCHSSYTNYRRFETSGRIISKP